MKDIIVLSISLKNNMFISFSLIHLSGFVVYSNNCLVLSYFPFAYLLITEICAFPCSCGRVHLALPHLGVGFL